MILYRHLTAQYKHWAEQQLRWWLIELRKCKKFLNNFEEASLHTKHTTCVTIQGLHLSKATFVDQMCHSVASRLPQFKGSFKKCGLVFPSNEGSNHWILCTKSYPKILFCASTFVDRILPRMEQLSWDTATVSKSYHNTYIWIMEFDCDTSDIIGSRT